MKLWLKLVGVGVLCYLCSGWACTSKPGPPTPQGNQTATRDFVLVINAQ